MNLINIAVPDSFRGMPVPEFLPYYPDSNLPTTQEDIIKVAKAVSPYFLADNTVQCFCWGLYEDYLPMVFLHPRNPYHTRGTGEEELYSFPRYGCKDSRTLKFELDLGTHSVRLDPVVSSDQEELIRTLNIKEWGENDPITGLPNYFRIPNFKFYASHLVNRSLDGYYFE